MATPRPYIKFLAIIAVILTLTTGCATTFRSEPDNLSARMERLRRATERYSTRGRDAAEDDYLGIGPFFIGTITGITLPAATVGPAYVFTEVTSRGTIRDIAAAAVGISSFTFWLWGGNELSKKMPTPKPDRYTADISASNRKEFEQVYNTRIEDIRSSRFRSGTLFGAVIIPLVVLSVVFSNFGAPGV